MCVRGEWNETPPGPRRPPGPAPGPQRPPAARAAEPPAPPAPPAAAGGAGEGGGGRVAGKGHPLSGRAVPGGAGVQGRPGEGSAPGRARQPLSGEAAAPLVVRQGCGGLTRGLERKCWLRKGP